MFARRAAAEDSTEANPHHFALLSDTHIPGDPKVTSRGVNMHDHLKAVASRLVALPKKPAAVLMNGDCAHLTGQEQDYQALQGLIAPIRAAGMPIHMGLGNHDDRAKFRSELEIEADDVWKHVTVVESPRANWFVLDSLDNVNKAPGQLGDKQLKWLAEALDARPNKPALVVVHHDLDGRGGSLQDSEALFEVLATRSQTKAIFYGHTHDWRITQRHDLHLVNLPPVAYVFRPGQPSGYVDAELLADGVKLTLRTVDPSHKANGEESTLRWRSG
jgi:3',5'-cyclic AMP phosphodiesterase CpdA